MEVWNLKGYTNWTVSGGQVHPTLKWIQSNRERYFTNKVPFDDFVFITYDVTFQLIMYNLH